jgi:hypothetical protein
LVLRTIESGTLTATIHPVPNSYVQLDADMGAGNDNVLFDVAASENEDGFTWVHHVRLGDGDDHFVGTIAANANPLDGDQDYLRTGNLDVEGGNGNDDLTLDFAADWTFNGTPELPSGAISGGNGNDTIRVTSDNAALQFDVSGDAGNGAGRNAAGGVPITQVSAIIVTTERIFRLAIAVSISGGENDLTPLNLGFEIEVSGIDAGGSFRRLPSVLLSERRIKANTRVAALLADSYQPDHARYYPRQSPSVGDVWRTDRGHRSALLSEYRR